MNGRLEVGQSCEVVKILTDGRFGNSFKINGFTIGTEGNFGVYCLTNGQEQLSSSRPLYMNREEIEKVGKLTITKVK